MQHVAVQRDEQTEFEQVEQLISLFNQSFMAYNTRLVRGQDEPIYLPAGENSQVNQIVFAHGYFSSALHEIAHWCIAGDERRKQVDYGYWYCPDGRDNQQQVAFEKVEQKPQAIEWAFTVATGRCFGVSTDNLNGVQPDRKQFASFVAKQLAQYCDIGFPPRAQRFINALEQHYGQPTVTYATCMQMSKDLMT